MANLLARLGGKTAVNTVSKNLYKHLVSDAQVNSYFKNTNVDKQAEKMTDFLCAAFGGPAWTGKDMVTVHKNMKISDAHFDAVCGHLKSSLGEAGVNQELTKEVMDIAESVRKAVVTV